MLTRELRLIPSQVLERAAEGWWIPGPDPVTWIAEVSTWGVEQAQLSFHPLSDQPQGSPLGVFVLSGRTTTPRTSPGVTPFGSIFGYLYLPVRCNLDPH